MSKPSFGQKIVMTPVSILELFRREERLFFPILVNIILPANLLWISPNLPIALKITYLKL
jgi:hypothetical protein